MLLIITGLCVKNIHLLSKFFWQGCRNCLLCDYTNILSENFFPKKLFSVDFFGTSIETFTASCGNFLAWFSKLQPTCRREILGRKSFFESSYFIFLSFSNLERKNNGNVKKCNREVCQIYILLVHRNSLRNSLSLRKFLFQHFSDFDQKVSSCWSNLFWQGCQNLHSMCPLNHLQTINFVELFCMFAT